ncbi:hypothetical protein BVX94_01205, partial [bacterium B17]
WHGWGRYDASRVGDYKLKYERGKGVAKIKNGPALINLREDPGERKDVSAEHPEKVKEMLALAKERLQDIHDNYVCMAASDDAKWRVKDWKPGKKWGKWLKEK